MPAGVDPVPTTLLLTTNGYAFCPVFRPPHCSPGRPGLGTIHSRAGYDLLPRRRHAASNGARLRNGHCAVDPKKIPYGSKIILNGEELIAVDTGPAVVSRKAARGSGRNRAEREAMVVDRYFETRSQALAWEKSHPH